MGRALTTDELDRGTVRFGTLVVAVSFEQPRYRRALDTHFRAVVGPPVESAALSLEVVELDEVAPLLTGDTALTVVRSGDRTTWSMELGWARLDHTAGEAVVALRPTGQRPEVTLHCFAVLVQKILQAVGLIRLHAGGAVLGDRVAVFVGDKGAGKSTLALALGRHGATVLGDDQLALERHDGAVTVAGSDGRIRLTAETEAHFFAAPLPIVPVVLAGVAKKEARLADLVEADAHRGHRPTDLWFPEVGARYDLSPMTGREALRRLLAALVPHHRFADGPDRREFVDLVTSLVEATAVSRLTLTTDLDDLERVAQELHR
jgi:hypothetical protein